MAENKISALLIAGPTASGKSQLALRLAERLSGVLVNADSMQVYRDLRILTARPSAADEERTPHYLFGHVDGSVNYSVGRYVEDVGRVLVQLRAEGRLSIFVGGTGLYFKALTQGLSNMPLVPEEVRADWRARAEAISAAALYAELAARDPIMAARLKPSDPQRILRALEVHAATGKSLAFFQGVRAKPLLDFSACRAVFLAPERATLKAAIDRRFDGMIESGALDEAAALGHRGLGAALPVTRALGVPQLLAHIGGRADLEKAIENAKRDTRAYTKRQFTFARHQLTAFQWVSPGDAEELLLTMR